MADKSPKIIALNGVREEKESEAKLIVDDEIIELDSFILSGTNTDGKRCVLTWNCSFDELASYSLVLETVVRDKIKEALNE